MDGVQWDLDIKDTFETNLVDGVQWDLDIKDTFETNLVDGVQWDLDIKDTLGIQPSGWCTVEPGYKGHSWDPT